MEIRKYIFSLFSTGRFGRFIEVTQFWNVKITINFNSTEVSLINFRYIKKQYNNPRVIITENGWADDGQLNDQDRIEFLRDHLTEVLNVVNNNECDLFGYTGKLPQKIALI